MYYPAKDDFKKIAKKYNLIPVYREIIADIETPVSAFLKIDNSDFAFLLESAEKGERFGRYSFLGKGSKLTLSAKDGKAKITAGKEGRVERTSDPLKIVEKLLSGYNPYPAYLDSPFIGGAVGYVGYDAIRYFESIPRNTVDDLLLPDAFFLFPDTLLIFDHLEHKIKVVVCSYLKETQKDLDDVYEECITKIEALIKQLKKPLYLKPLKATYPVSDNSFKSNFSREEFVRRVEQAKEYIKAGDVLQVVLSQRFSKKFKGSSSFDLYRALRIINPSPYMYYLKFGDLKLIGSSPEPLVKVQGKEVITRPIAGTRPRGRTEKEDLQLRKELLLSEKERAEHLMLVDLGRNDLGKVCVEGSVKVTDFMKIEKYSHVMHIVSEVCGRLKERKTAFDALRAVFPAGTVTGAPKVRAMEIIDELEPVARGPYAGVVGYFDYLGNLDSCITIRTIIALKDKVYVQAGAGIVYDSVAKDEYEETKNKARALFRAVEMAGA